MGAFSGSMSYKLFFVQGDLPAEWKDAFFERIAFRAFTDLSPDDEDEQAYGWVQIERPLSKEFPVHGVLFNDYLNLGFRRDAYSIPAELFKAQLAEVQREFMVQNSVERLTRMQREDLKVLVRNDLKRRTLPSLKVTDMSWNLTRGEVRFWSQSTKLCELFQGYFEDTFGLKLMPASPYVTGMHLDLDADLLAELATVEPTNFIDTAAQG